MDAAPRAALHPRFLRLATLAATLLLAAALSTPAAALKLNEIRPWSGSTGVGDSTEAFPNLVELYNETGSAQSVAGWHLGGATASDLIALPAWSIPAGAYLTVVFGAGTDDADFSDNAGTFHAGATGWVLAPDAGEVGLYDAAPAAASLKDFVSYGIAGGSFGVAYGHSQTASQWPAGQFVDLTGQSIFAHVSRIPSGFDADTTSDWNEMEASFVSETTPDNAIQLAPRNGTLQESLAQYAWRGLAHADSYFVEVASDSFFTTVVESVITDSTVYTPPAPLADGVYFWRVRPYIGGSPADPAARWVYGQTDLSISPEKWRRNRAEMPFGGAYALVPQFFQHKDSGMLCLWNRETASRMGCTETAGNNGPWDAAHPTGNHILNCRHCGMYCTRAAIQMINAQFGGSLLQDEISYNLKNGDLAGPEGDLGHGIGAWASENNTYSWSLNGVAAPEALNGNAAIPWNTYKAQIDAGRPVLAAIAPPGILHSVVLTGYFEFWGFRWIHITDPWPGRTGWYFWSLMPVRRYYTLPLAGAITGRAGDGAVITDTDGDGVVDFDEGNPRPLESDAHSADTDWDGVGDKADIGTYTFHRLYHPSHFSSTLGFADVDGDGNRGENDCDADGDGDYDRAENLDGDARVFEAGETCPHRAASVDLTLAVTGITVCPGGQGKPVFAGGTLAPHTTYDVAIYQMPCANPAYHAPMNADYTVTTNGAGNITTQAGPCLPPGLYVAAFGATDDGLYEPGCDPVVCFTIDVATATLAAADLAAAATPGGPRVTWWSRERAAFDHFRVLRAAPGAERAAIATVENRAPGFPATLAFVDAAAEPGREYDYWVEGVKDGAVAVTLGPVRLADALPAALAFAGSHPNPFDAATTLAFDLPRGAGHVTLVLYDLAGRRVRTLVAGGIAPGRHRLAWDGRGDDGQSVRPGVYLARLVTGLGARTSRLVKTH